MSAEALNGLTQQRPGVSPRLVCGDFRRYEPAHRFGYVVAIQVFQHGTSLDAAEYFRRSAGPLVEPREDLPPKSGHWTRWEMAWAKR